MNAERENDPVAAIRALLAQDDIGDVSSLYRFGYYFQTPDLPAIKDITLAQSRAFHNEAKREWLRDLPAQVEEREPTTA
jgi:hypothetical protein